MTTQYSLQLNGHTLFKDDESYVDAESSYALSRRVSGGPSTKFGVQIPLKTQVLSATSVGFLASTITYHPSLHAIVCYW
jgi:hypothetical protein